jgi:uncharacterized protein (TIGR03435 family)
LVSKFDIMRQYHAPLMASAISATVLAVVAAQTVAPAAFEAASIKPDDSGGNYIEATRGTLTAHSATPATCIMWAYGVQSSQVSGANAAVSGLLQSARYTIVAKAAGPEPDSQLRMMFQTLLAERFKLAFHRQSRELQGLALVIEKSGPKFHESQGDGESKQQASSRLTRRWQWTTMAQLATTLGEAMQAPVTDETRLPGKYDFALDLTPYVTPGERPDISAMMVTAVREQLGLKLEPRRTATDVLVIDHLEKPTAN